MVVSSRSGSGSPLKKWDNAKVCITTLNYISKCIQIQPLSTSGIIIWHDAYRDSQIINEVITIAFINIYICFINPSFLRSYIIYINKLSTYQLQLGTIIYILQQVKRMTNYIWVKMQMVLIYNHLYTCTIAINYTSLGTVCGNSSASHRKYHPIQLSSHHSCQI